MQITEIFVIQETSRIKITFIFIVNKTLKALCHEKQVSFWEEVIEVKKTFCVDTICHLLWQESIFNTFWVIDDGIMMNFWVWMEFLYQYWAHILIIQNNFSFYESQSQRLLLEIDFFLNAVENHSDNFITWQYDSSFTVLYTVWMALADSPPRSHQHKCVMSHWWQGDCIVPGGQRQCLLPQIQSKVHTGKKERERKWLRFRAF